MGVMLASDMAVLLNPMLGVGIIFLDSCVVNDFSLPAPRPLKTLVRRFRRYIRPNLLFGAQPVNFPKGSIQDLPTRAVLDAPARR
jgi:hypothetical protein